MKKQTKKEEGSDLIIPTSEKKTDFQKTQVEYNGVKIYEGVMPKFTIL